jgi:hypothetical protein
VVGRELQFPAVRSAGFGAGHHSGVVHQDVKRSVPGLDERRDRGRIGEVERCDMHCVVASGVGDILGGTFAGRSVSHSQGDCSAGTGERASGLNADAGRRTGDHDAMAGQVDAGCDRSGGAGKAEAGLDGTHDGFS